MSDIKNLRGFKDIILEDAEKFNYIISTISEIAENYNFAKSYFPILEASDTYKRTLGEASDIVSKETYHFIDQGQNEVTLRPEFTAGIARSLIANKLYDKLPLKFFSYGPLFRYERPQQGRQRQFNQVNFEYFGNETFFAEIEIMLLIRKICKKLAIRDKINLEINSLGSNETRAKYRTELVAYLAKYKDSLSETSQTRLQVNPLRILDSKDKKDQEILNDGPKLKDFYSYEDQEFFTNILDYLAELKLEFIINNRMVRGLDYYSHTVFEFTTEELGAQNAVFAGGRYDKLVEMMGGKHVPAVGVAGGVERLMELVEIKQLAPEKNFILPVSELEHNFAFNILDEFRDMNFNFEIKNISGNLGKKLKKLDKENPHFVVIIGDQEIKNNKVLVKNFRTGQEHDIAIEHLRSEFRRIHNDSHLKRLKY